MTTVNIKPVLSRTVGFDASNEYTINYKWEGPFTITSAILTIYQDNAVIQTIEHNGMLCSIPIPANTLVNGTKYKITVKVKNNAYESLESSAHILYCDTAPDVSVDGILPVITSSCVTLGLNYHQAEAIPVHSFRLSVWDANGTNLIDQSEELYSTDSVYVFDGLKDNETYTFRLYGTTIHQTPFEYSVTAYADFIRPGIRQGIELSQSDSDGTITIDVTVIPVSCESNNISFTADNTAVDITRPGAFVTYQGGFNIKNDFTLQTECRAVYENCKLLDLSAQEKPTDRIEIHSAVKNNYEYHTVPKGTKESYQYGGSSYIRKVQSREFYLILKVFDNPSGEILLVESNHLDADSIRDKSINIWLQKKNNLYGLKIAEKEE
ncbi:MAG: hypothetical protein HFI34_10705 [Lachnospiraceae bacterium]|nr:hypothetical protein [Lachnospiraceae bacterium]